MNRIAFNDLPWEVSPSGVRFKVHKMNERQLRLLEFTPELDHPNWCETGHVGYVVEGALEIAFESTTIIFRAGDGVWIPPGHADRHRPRALSDRVRLIFVEDGAP